MGAWGYEALESDEGLDIVDCITDYVSEQKDKEKVDLTLSQLIALLKEKGFFGNDFDEIDFFYDNAAMALTELYFMFQDEGILDYEDEEDESSSLKDRVQSFEADKESLTYLLRYLTDMKNEVPDEDGEREIVELWKDSDCWEDWSAHLNSLINRVNKEIEKL